MLTGTGGWTGISFWVIEMPEELSIVATGEKWIGYGVRSFSSVTAEIMGRAKNELVMTIYMISDMNIVHNIQRSLERGVSATIFIYAPLNSYDRDTIEKLIDLEETYSYLTIHMLEDKVLHAKVLVADGRYVLMGSANATFGGMVKNYELGFFVNDGKIAHKILELLLRVV